MQFYLLMVKVLPACCAGGSTYFVLPLNCAKFIEESEVRAIFVQHKRNGQSGTKSCLT